MNQFSPLLVILNLGLLAAMIASAGIWIRLVWQNRRDLKSLPVRLVPPRRRDRPFWNPGDALVMFGLMQVVAGIIGASLIASGVIDRSEASSPGANALPLIGLTLAGGTAATVLTLLWLRIRETDVATKLGIRLDNQDAILGLKASLMILPPVLAISGLASLLIKYEHPVLDTLAIMSDPLSFSLIFIGTAIVTPFVEEFTFRVLLQGGLERIANPAIAPESAGPDATDGVSAAASESLAGDSRNPYQPPAPTSQPLAVADESDWPSDAWRSKSLWPMLVSSLIFALMHLGQGAAPIPLFVLALGLGYLYRQTGNMTAPMVVHMVLNGTTIIVEAVRIQSGN